MVIREKLISHVFSCQGHNYEGGYFKGVVRGDPEFRARRRAYETFWGHSGVPTTNIYTFGENFTYFWISCQKIFFGDPTSDVGDRPLLS